MKSLISIFLVVYTTSLFAHTGSTYKDGPLVGCHQDKKKGNFHCHKNSKLNGQSFQSEDEALKALGQNQRHTKYERESWGNWATGPDCLDTRNKILKERSLIPVEMKNCKVITGKWDDYYYSEVLTNASDIDIDHVVPIKEAHDSGASVWSFEKKRAFYNDPENLVITNLRYNRQKGSKTILEWMPINRSYACKYVKNWMHIKTKYQLTITDREREEERTGACR